MRAIQITVLATLGCLYGCSRAEDRLPVPADAAQKAADRLIKEIFKAEYSKGAPADLCALAQKLLKQGLETKDDMAARYVLFREASAIAGQNGDIPTAIQSVEELAKSFNVDGLAHRIATLDQLLARGTTQDAFKALAGLYFALAEELASGDQHDKALQALDKGIQAGRRAQDLPLVTRAMARQKEIREAQAAFDKLSVSKRKLLENPDDADCNFAVGKHYCIAKGDWETGLPMLSNGAQPKFAEAAKADLAAAQDANLQLAAGDHWWELAQELPKAEADAIKARAGFWYGKIIPGLAGITKAKVERRLQEAQALSQPTASASSPQAQPSASEATIGARLKAFPTKDEIGKLVSRARAYKDKGDLKAYEEYMELFKTLSGRLAANPEKWNEEDWKTRMEADKQIAETADTYDTLVRSLITIRFRVWKVGPAFAVAAKSNSDLLARLKLIGTRLSYKQVEVLGRIEKTFRQIVLKYMDSNPQTFLTPASKAQFCEWLKTNGISDSGLDELQKELRDAKP